MIRLGDCTGISIVDSTPLRVCNNKRIFNHKVFDGITQRGKSTMGYFFGFKLHLVINDKGEILNFVITPGNVDDREPLKNICQIEHSRHRSFGNFLTNLISGLLAYSFLPKKPSIKYDVEPTFGQLAIF